MCHAGFRASCSLVQNTKGACWATNACSMSKLLSPGLLAFVHPSLVS
jgi:hypothetical protein